MHQHGPKYFDCSPPPMTLGMGSIGQSSSFFRTWSLLYPATKVWRGIMLYPSVSVRLSVRPSVHPSVRPSVRTISDR